MMSLKARFALLLGFGLFVVYPVRWAETHAPVVVERQAAVAHTSSCRLVSRVVRIKVSVSRYPENWRHIRDARAGRSTGPDGVSVIDDGKRWPSVLVKNDVGEDKRRRAGERMSGLPSRWSEGFARDEYPPAVGRASNAADFRYVNSRQNSAQGASMGGQLRRFCNGQRFRLVAAP